MTALLLNIAHAIDHLLLLIFKLLIDVSHLFFHLF